MTQCKEGSQREGLMLDSSEELYKWFTQQVCWDSSRGCIYSGTSLIWTPVGQKKLSLFQRVEMHARVVLVVGKGVLAV